MKNFIIDHIDPLGQGVFKENDQIFFIPKTLPGEEGNFDIVKKSKGVHFGILKSLTKESSERREPECIHFSECNGCHFLHTHYQFELEHKRTQFTRLLSKLAPGIKVESIASPRRLHYRNRIQLHYNTKRNLIGFKKARSNKIFNITDCKIILPELKNAFNDILKTWKEQAAVSKKPQGHIEIYKHNDEIKISWNLPYAEGGFSQVNSEVNREIQNLISANITGDDKSVLDLFGGNGNLSEQLETSQKISVDLYKEERDPKRFLNINLFEDNALENFLNQSHIQSFDQFIIDPPRSGFKEIASWSEHFTPQFIVYVSCHPATMIRDLAPLSKEYKITQAYIADLFPATFHYEGILFLERQS